MHFFFFKHVFFFPLSSRRLKFESVITLFSMKYGTWFLDEQDTRQDTELKKSVVQSVLLCLACLFIYILTSKLKKKTWKKIKQAKKKKEVKAWILLNQTGTEKQMRTAALRHTIYFFSLTMRHFPGLSLAPVGQSRVHFYSSLPSFLLWIFSHLPHHLQCGMKVKKKKQLKQSTFCHFVGEIYLHVCESVFKYKSQHMLMPWS